MSRNTLRQYAMTNTRTGVDPRAQAVGRRHARRPAGAVRQRRINEGLTTAGRRRGSGSRRFRSRFLGYRIGRLLCLLGEKALRLCGCSYLAGGVGATDTALTGDDVDKAVRLGLVRREE